MPACTKASGKLAYTTILYTIYNRAIFINIIGEYCVLWWKNQFRIVYFIFFKSNSYCWICMLESSKKYLPKCRFVSFIKKCYSIQHLMTQWGCYQSSVDISNTFYFFTKLVRSGWTITTSCRMASRNEWGSLLLCVIFLISLKVWSEHFRSHGLF